MDVPGDPLAAKQTTSRRTKKTQRVIRTRHVPNVHSRRIFVTGVNMTMPVMQLEVDMVVHLE